MVENKGAKTKRKRNVFVMGIARRRLVPFTPPAIGLAPCTMRSRSINVA